jgi:hypothetical protein
MPAFQLATPKTSMNLALGSVKHDALAPTVHFKSATARLADRGFVDTQGPGPNRSAYSRPGPVQVVAYAQIDLQLTLKRVFRRRSGRRQMR